MTQRPPLANLLAIHHADPREASPLIEDMRSSGEFSEVFSTPEGWVVGTAPLPRSEPDGEDVRAAGLVFAQGRDVVMQVPDSERCDRIREIVGLAAEHPENLDRLPGDFGFLHLRDHGSGTVVRACGGLAPFYVKARAGRVAIATRLGDLVRYLSDEPEIDPLVCAVWTTGFCIFPDNRTFLKDVSIVPRGNALVVNPEGRSRLVEYWDPRQDHIPKPTPEIEREHADRLRTILLDTLERDLDPDGGNLLTLSGGVDSSSLAALAAGTLQKEVWTLSFLPPDDATYRREMSYIDPLCKEFGITRRFEIRLDPEKRMDLLDEAPHVAFPILHPALCALPAICEEHPVRVLFGGEFADEVCGSHYTIGDWAETTSPLALLANLSRLPYGPKDVLRWARGRGLDLVGRPHLYFPRKLHEWVREDVRHEYQDWRSGAQERLREDRRSRRHLASWSQHDGWVAMNWEATTALGVRRSIPFFGREALELAFQCHPNELVSPGSKKLLRNAVPADVPSSNLYRPDKGRWAGYDARSRLQRSSGTAPPALADIAFSGRPVPDSAAVASVSRCLGIAARLATTRPGIVRTVARVSAGISSVDESMPEEQTANRPPYMRPEVADLGTLQEATRGTATGDPNDSSGASVA